MPKLFQNLQREPSIQFSSDCPEQSAYRSCCSPLLADDFAEIAFGNSQFENGCLLSGDFINNDLVWDIDESFGNLFY